MPPHLDAKVPEEFDQTTPKLSCTPWVFFSRIKTMNTDHLIHKQAIRLAAATSVPINTAEQAIREAIGTIPVCYPPKSIESKLAEYRVDISEAILDALGNEDRCYVCGKSEHYKTDDNGVLCERCANYKGTPIVNEKSHIGRNSPCPCGSGRRFKACCLRSG